MTQKEIVVNNPSAKLLSIVEKLKEEKRALLNEMRSQRGLSVELNTK